ncbi:MAG: thioesterase [Deltaproteobacteria bacterium]|nr:thioesterase [Deltaproteobacteria bacterium]
MGIVHHANYLHLFERGRVLWMEEHHRSYTDFIERGLHLAVTQVKVDYHASAGFDNRLTVTTWLDWVRGASLAMSYHIYEGSRLTTSGTTEHAAVDEKGRVRRIPREDQTRLRALACHSGTSLLGPK